LRVPIGHKNWYKKYDNFWHIDFHLGDIVEAHSFGYWLKLKRKALDLTREGLAGRVGCSAGTIQKLEEEERRPSAQMAERLAEIFNISPNEQPAFLRFARGELHSRIAETQQDAPWNTSAKLPRSNLPIMVTSLIGREKEIADIHNYLLRADVRLVTLIGPPGIGKTRLSIESAHTALPDFPNGVFFVALASFDSPALIAVTVAQAMGYVGAGHVSTMEQLKEGIGNKQLLIVLDNCEHMIEDVASLASSLLSICPRLKILATSRESLRVPGEWLYPVPALDVPALDSSGENSSVDMDDILNFPALTLFAERARAVRPNFTLDAENIKAISAICKQLDGLPLAIELIAARMRLITPQVLSERLQDEFLLSADGMRGVPTRQKSLKDAIDWSYKLLSEEEQKLFSYLSVFSGGFTLEAETIFSQAFTETTVSALIASLFDKSLLQRTFDSRGEARYVMLATIQEFARQRLGETDREAEIRNWHLAYFLNFVGQADRELRGPNQSEMLKRLNAMRDNLRVALDWAIETGQTEKALQLARNLWWFWSKRSEFNEGRQWLERVISLHEASLFPNLYADVLTQLAHHACLQIGVKEAKPFVEQALAIARTQDNRQTLANTLMVFGIVLTYEENFSAARSALEESITLFREVQDQWGYAVVLMSLGFSAYKRDDRATALELAEQALAAFRELGDQYFQSVCLYETGNLRAKQGEWEEGLAKLRESLRLSHELGSRYEIAGGLFRLAETEQQLGQPVRAVRLYCAAKNVYDSIGAWHQDDDLKLEQYLAPCRLALGESDFAEAVAQGRAMTTEQAIAYALEDRE
jgi:predicted ATPase/transcriptional regulator with XRE-family HTH domain